jgi:hypothetical protein
MMSVSDLDRILKLHDGGSSCAAPPLSTRRGGALLMRQGSVRD